MKNSFYIGFHRNPFVQNPFSTHNQEDQVNIPGGASIIETENNNLLTTESGSFITTEN